MTPNSCNYIPLSLIIVFITTQVIANDVEDKRREDINKGLFFSVIYLNMCLCI